MRKRFVFLLAVSVCLALAATPLMAADRSKSAIQRTQDSENVQIDRGQLYQPVPLQVRSAATSNTGRAEALMAQAAKATDPAEAANALFQAIALDPNNEKLVSEAYTQLGTLYGDGPKAVHMLGMAIQYTSDPGARAALQARISQLGGDVYTLAVRPTDVRDAGPDDTCDGAVAHGVPYTEIMSVTPLGDYNWRSFDVPGPEGWVMRIENRIVAGTTGSCPWGPDTNLGLYGSCTAGVPGDFILFEEDDDFFNQDYMNDVTTDCLAPGTYYAVIGGYFDYCETYDFEYAVTQVDSCILPAPDAYESDDTKGLATEIGYRTSIPPHANGWGRAKKEIQSHSIYPNGDLDNMLFILNRPEMVRMKTAQVFPTKFNDFMDVPAGYDIDTVLELFYGVEPDYGGFCNDPDNGFSPYCRSDDDCPPPIGPPIPGLPTCMPMFFFSFGGSLIFFPETPLAFNDDAPGLGFGSELMVCLPRGGQPNQTLSADGDWIARVTAYSASATFSYQVQVRNEVRCNYEVELNDALSLATPMNLGETWHGISEYNYWFGTEGVYGSDWFSTDYDWFGPFDVDVESIITFATDGYDSYLCDTFLGLAVGPDDFGSYYWVAQDDDGGPGWLSFIAGIAPPASELLGNTMVDADYYILVSSLWLNANFPYQMDTTVEVYVEPNTETEPNDSCPGNAFDDSAPIEGSLPNSGYPDYYCDIDAFTFTLDEDAYIVLKTDGGDTAMALSAAGESTFLACDDDSGGSFTSQIEGCLPAGDYCVKVRPYSNFSSLSSYELDLDVAPGCLPEDPPDMIDDDDYTCDGSGYASPEDEFNNSCHGPY